MSKDFFIDVFGAISMLLFIMVMLHECSPGGSLCESFDDAGHCAEKWPVCR